jgi:hypothetical protein
MILVYWIRSFLVSVVLGVVWFDTEETDVQAKLMLATTAYLYIVGCLADLFEGTHRRQTDYLRERFLSSLSPTLSLQLISLISECQWLKLLKPTGGLMAPQC